MIKIAFIAPYRKLIKIARDVFREQNHHHCQLEEILGIGFEFVKNMSSSADVILARGVTAAACRHYFKDTPVVELQVTSYDVIRAVHQTRHLNPRQVAVIGSRSMIYGADTLSDVLNVDIKTFLVEQEQQAEKVINKVRESGIEIVIGGAMTCQIAAKKGLHTSVIESGKESVWNALKEAELVAQVRQKEQQRAQLFKTVLDYANEGIIAVNRDGQITNFNASAAKITGIREHEALHQLSSKVLPDFNMDKIVTSSQPALRELISVGSTKVMANRVPIKVDNNITGAVITFQDVTRIQQLENQVRKQIYNRGHVAKLNFDSILGQSKAIKECITTAKQFSVVDSNVLIYGSTGTGKEVFAQSIHNASSRSRGPFVALNCGALPENLLESELFGYVEGAFTGAVKGGKPGVFELAHGGTIFLDEISETSPHMQAKLLRVLQEKEVRRIGDHKVIPIDVRVIAATNRSLSQLVEKGDFRKDLYYRLNVLNLTLPDLAERKEDIPVLLEYFLQEFCKRLGRDRVELSPEALKLLQKYQWPGNIRELQNAAERLAVQLSGIGQPMDIYRIIPELRQQNSLHNLYNDRSTYTKDLEYKTIVKVMKEVNYNKTEAAKLLGISRTTLWRKLKEFHNK